MIKVIQINPEEVLQKIIEGVEVYRIYRRNGYYDFESLSWLSIQQVKDRLHKKKSSFIILEDSDSGDED